MIGQTEIQPANNTANALAAVVVTNAQLPLLTQKPIVAAQQQQPTSFQQATTTPITSATNRHKYDSNGKNEYVNGRVKEEPRVNYETYYSHSEKVPENYHPLVQYLNKTELKYYNDNLFYETPIGFPTKAL